MIKKPDLSEILTESDQVIKLIENTICDGILSFDQTSKSFWSNKKLNQLLGIDGTENIVLDKVLRKEDYNSLLNAIAHKQSFDQQIQFIESSGYSIWMRAHITYFNNTSLNVLITLQNITKYKEKEEFMLQCNSEAKIGYWELDLINDSLYWSDVTREIMGESQSQKAELDEAFNIYKEGWSRDQIKNLLIKQFIKVYPTKKNSSL